MRPSGRLVACLSALLAPVAVFAAPPMAVSPEGDVASPCPTFSWAQTNGAPGYELVVYELAAHGTPGDTPVLLRLLPAGTGSWTPSAKQYLTPGSYAWSVRVAGQPEEEWSAPLIFEVNEAPSITEVEGALATLRRHLDQRQPNSRSPVKTAGDRTEAPAWRPLSDTAAHQPLMSLTAAAAPSLAHASLTISDQIHLDSYSSVFKDGSLFLWDDLAGNLALGRRALSSATIGINNTAVGEHALFQNTYGHSNTAVGSRALARTTGGFNTALGSNALYSTTTGGANTAAGQGALFLNTTGERNTAIGTGAMFTNGTGYQNTAIGSDALFSNNEGSRNVAVGYRAGFSAPQSASYNVFIAHQGDIGDSTPTIRLGSQNTQTRAFIAGIYGASLTGDIQDVCVSNAGQLGPCPSISSRRFKEDIRELEGLTARLLDLRPVSFRFRPGVADEGKDLHFGLIAEEVAEVFPELVVYDEQGKPETVKYHLLSALLLNELKEEHALNRAQSEELKAVKERLAALEEGHGSPPHRRAWWRRRAHESP